jgi:hypothetical protein
MTATSSKPSMESLEDRQVAQQLAETESRLIEHYRDRDGITEERVRSTFGSVRDRFAQARIRSFLPILVERGVQVELGR